MRKLLLFSIASLASATSSFSLQGGPDGFGYTWMDSNEPGGPSYAWFDITQIGSQLSGFGDDNFIGPKPLGGPFTYYWYTVDKCWIGSNGYISFQPGNIAANFPAIPNPTGVNDYITGFMADLMFLGSGNPGKVYYYVGTDTFCMAWVNVPFWSPNPPGYTGSCTFEILLVRSDSSITINFQNCQGVTQSNISVGIENSVGNMGLQPMTFFTSPLTNYTIKYYYPNNPLSVADAGAMFNNNPNNGGLFLPALGNPFTLTSNVKNTGNTALGPVNLGQYVRYTNNVAVVTNSAVTGPLAIGDDTTITHSNLLNPPAASTLKCVTTVFGDTISANDSVIQEIVTVDTTQNTIRLCWTNNHQNTVQGSISWNGGQGGVGQYFKPPTYPARIVSTNFVCTGTTTGQYTFYAKIYDDNGPSGSPGTLLDSVAVLTSSVITYTPITVPVSSNIVIASGGVYVLWDMAGTGAAIGEDWTKPISRHAYEVFANYWSNYREYQTRDFFIGIDYQKAVPEDVGVCKIQNPINNATISTPTTVSCWIKNFGTQPDNYFITVKYKLGLSGVPTAQAYTGPAIQPGDSVLFTFTQQLTPPYSAQDILCCWTEKSTDVQNMNDTTCINLTLIGMPEYTVLEGVKVYPNPLSDQLNSGMLNMHFDSGLEEKGMIRVQDIFGRTVYEMPLSPLSQGSVVKIGLGHLAPGVYNYTVTSGLRRASGKIVKY